MICRPGPFREDDEDAETDVDGDEESHEPVELSLTRPDCRVGEQDELEDFDDDFDEDFEDELGDEYGFESDEVFPEVPEVVDGAEFEDVSECLSCVDHD